MIDKPITIRGKVIRQGNGYYVNVKKALVDSGVFEHGKKYIFQLVGEVKETVVPIHSQTSDIENAVSGMWSRDLVGCQV